MKKLLNAVALAGALLGASTAGAATLITDWTYNVATDWITANTVFSGGGGAQTNTTSLISWGAAAGSHLVFTGDPTLDRSALAITNSPTAGSIQTNGASEAGATVTHFNHTIDGSFAALRSTSLTTSLLLTSAIPIFGIPIAPPPLNFDVNFIETPNISGSCAPPSASVCDDIFVIALPDLTQGFDLLGYHYTVNIFDTGGFLHFLSDAQCAAAGVANGCYGLQTIENAQTPINFEFNITATLIPEPESLALFAAALFALGAVMRRKTL
ncbi:MAG TPA: THxN family PEP-CTERM protein [Burkholderiaceae bacterium]|nr:THxN family PEP-CTERM protein [Burkholderiaceae bacterium]